MLGGCDVALSAPTREPGENSGITLRTHRVSLTSPFSFCVDVVYTVCPDLRDSTDDVTIQGRMVTSEPRADRCAAQVTSKVGLVVDTDDIDGTITDEQLRECRLQGGPIEETVPPAYETIREYLYGDYRLRGLVFDDASFDVDRIGADLETASLDDGGLLVWLEDRDPYVTHRETELDGYCEKYPSKKSDTGRCYLHGAEGSGAPDPVGNAMEHSLYAQRSNYFQSCSTDEQQYIEALAESWIDSTDQVDRDNVAKVNEIWRAAIDQHRLWNALDEFADEDMVVEQIIGIDEATGEPIEVDDENPINLPYSRLDNDVQKRLDRLGVYDDEDETDDTAESLASALAEIASDAGS